MYAILMWGMKVYVQLTQLFEKTERSEVLWVNWRDCSME